MYRLFVAIDPPDHIKKQLQSICLGVPGARWLEPSQMHLTLRFVGEVDGGVFRDVLEVIREVKGHPFELTLKGVGFFPPRQNPEQLWVGVNHSDELTVLQGRVESALVRAGLKKERRKFTPHVTLAFLKAPKVSRVAGFLTENSLLSLEPFPVSEFCLFSSVLSSQGALHEIEAVYQLNGKG